MVSTAATATRAVKIVFATRRSGANHRPTPSRIAVQVGKRDERRHQDAGNEDAAHEGGVVDQLLQAQEVPGSLGRVRGSSGVRHLLQREP